MVVGLHVHVHVPMQSLMHITAKRASSILPVAKCTLYNLTLCDQVCQ